MDGLPTLKVQTLTQEGIKDHRRSNTTPVPLLSIHPQHTREANRPLTLPKVNYAQILLEEDDDEYSEAQDEIVVKRVLIWRPGRRKHPPRGGSPTRATTHQPNGCCEHEIPLVKDGGVVQPSSIVMGGDRPPVVRIGEDKPSNAATRTANVKPSSTVEEGGNQVTVEEGGNQATEDSKHNEARNLLKVFKTNLTDILPSCSKRHKNNLFLHKNSSTF